MFIYPHSYQERIMLIGDFLFKIFLALATVIIVYLVGVVVLHIIPGLPLIVSIPAIVGLVACMVGLVINTIGYLKD
jgi:hypothetical protein